MELRFDYRRDRLSYMVRFEAGSFESVPLLRELRFWGVDRVPCPNLTTLAALIVLKKSPVSAVTVSETALAPAVCTVLSQYFDVEIHPDDYDLDRRALVGGDISVAPLRFHQSLGVPDWVRQDQEVLTWLSLNDLRGPFGGQIRTNLDAFDLSEAEKSLIVALCCAGKELGHVILDTSDPDLARVFHRIGLELVDASEAV